MLRFLLLCLIFFVNSCLHKTRPVYERRIWFLYMSAEKEIWQLLWDALHAMSTLHCLHLHSCSYLVLLFGDVIEVFYFQSHLLKVVSCFYLCWKILKIEYATDVMENMICLFCCSVAFVASNFSIMVVILPWGLTAFGGLGCGLAGQIVEEC